MITVKKIIVNESGDDVSKILVSIVDGRKIKNKEVSPALITAFVRGDDIAVKVEVVGVIASGPKENFKVFDSDGNEVSLDTPQDVASAINILTS